MPSITQADGSLKWKPTPNPQTRATNALRRGLKTAYPDVWFYVRRFGRVVLVSWLDGPSRVDVERLAERCLADWPGAIDVSFTHDIRWPGNADGCCWCVVCENTLGPQQRWFCSEACSKSPVAQDYPIEPL
jgi:hypothetical protein